MNYKKLTLGGCGSVIIIAAAFWTALTRSVGFAALRLPFGLPFGREHFVVVIRPHLSIRICNPK